jgi:hypothetical protein
MDVMVSGKRTIRIVDAQCAPSELQPMPSRSVPAGVKVLLESMLPTGSSP